MEKGRAVRSFPFDPKLDCREYTPAMSTATFTSFLRSICDPRVGYVGCSNVVLFSYADNYFLVLHGVAFALYMMYLAMRFAKHTIKAKKSVSDWFNDMDTTALLASTHNLVRLGYLTRTRLASGFDMTAMTDAELQGWVGGNIGVEFFTWTIDDVTALKYQGANLYEPFKFRGKTIDPSKALKLFRVFVLSCNVTLFTVWGTVGVNSDVATYYLLKRFCYFFVGFVSTFVSSSILFFFGNQVIKTLKEGMGLNSGTSSVNGKKTESSGTALGSAMTSASPTSPSAPLKPNQTRSSAVERPSQGGMSIASSISTVQKKRDEANAAAVFRVKALEVAILMIVFILSYPPTTRVCSSPK
ncbi:hypothetical protein HDV03_003121 [Kappamyces sp. JEL0829]|nr:hypothetical protein HDV03_003106 [Kappamyces sp. JEL0829]KAJ3304135.1 hypothetical protein HDV03_003121 [Kappamyces sp. JEL0829]